MACHGLSRPLLRSAVPLPALGPPAKGHSASMGLPAHMQLELGNRADMR